ncbi:Uncharacterized conserved protein YecE, DUF72 family [Paractinoplanes atraurantiacus]|uniref:Uncharacterized conserved protein YecE, DUF72 family n=1 Tax=Paractinoplanes atraurantiacus TaxID=1036182 RepID=A0A285J4T3_9ACTN|nr:Uncharacterized conserved protein YecE, DUF72 family [Actinoplanes atraurantiacus]
MKAYAEWCDAVEGNTTFYATPSRETVAGWARQTPPDFRFVLKLPKPVTHEHRLGRGGEEDLARFLHAIEPLGNRVHALWVQLPGSFGPGDLEVLASFLGRMPQAYSYAVEVRHSGFFDDPRGLESVLEKAGAEWVPFDTTVMFASPPTSDMERDAWMKKPRMPRRMRALTARPIVRYLGRDDTARTVEGWQPWVETVSEWLKEGRSPTFFVHTPDNVDAPALARRFHDEVRQRTTGLAALPEPVPTTLF